MYARQLIADRCLDLPSDDIRAQYFRPMLRLDRIAFRMARTREKRGS